MVSPRVGAWGYEPIPAWEDTAKVGGMTGTLWSRDTFDDPGGNVWGRYLSGFDSGGIFDYANKLQAENDAWFNQQPSYAGSGQVATGGGKWAELDKYNADAAKAQTDFGVPANLVKAVLAREGSFGHDFYTTMVDGHPTPILAFNGIFQDTAESRGLDWQRMISDPHYAVWATGKVLGDIYKEQNGQYGWEGAANTYFTGSPTGTADSAGTTSADYLHGPNGVITHWQELDKMVGGGASMDPANPNYGGKSGGPAFTTMFGPQATVPDWGEFDAPSSLGLYKYGVAYGMDPSGTHHTGIDVPMDLNSPIYAPTGGTVMCAGTGVGQDSQGGSCAAFNNYYGNSGPGPGRIEVQLDNGAVLIFGHSSSSAVRPGQRITAGMLLGLSGGQNSPHVHLEARIQDASGNWKIVDPRSVLGGTPYAPPSGGAPSGGSPAGNWWQQPITQMGSATTPRAPMHWWDMPLESLVKVTP